MNVNVHPQKLSPKEYKELKIEDVLTLPFTAKNGINFFKDRSISNFYMYNKNNCRGTIQLDNCVYGHNVYGLMVDSTAYWTHHFGDTRGSASVRVQPGESTRSILNRLAKEIEKRYQAYHKF